MNTPVDMVPGTRHPTNYDGDIEVVDYKKADCVTVRFFDPYYETTTSAGHIRNGKVRNRLKPKICGIGYLGSGPHKAAKSSKIYQCWDNMIRRCYSNLLRYKTYEGCTVHASWHNFQKFAEWYILNYPNDGGNYDLDKDIKVHGNKQYGPDACLFVTRTENSVAAMAKVFVVKSPGGNTHVIHNMKDFCRGTDLNHRHMCEVANGTRKSHKGWLKAA